MQQYRPWRTKRRDNSVSIPIRVESGIYTAHALIETAAESTCLSVLPLEYLALTAFESVEARALVWVHARTVAHAFLATSTVVLREITLLVFINEVEQTCLGVRGESLGSGFGFTYAL